MKKVAFRLLVILLLLMALMFLTPCPAIIAESEEAGQIKVQNYNRQNILFYPTAYKAEGTK